MPLVIPPAENYPTPLVSLPVAWDRDPVEGSRIVPVEIDWDTMGGPDNCVDLNLFGNAAQTISQIVALSVDNSACGSNVRFIFPDTAQTYQVKAETPVATFPVFTNATELFVVADGPKAGDVTRFAVLNSMPPPVALGEAVPPTETASAGQIAVGTPVTAIVPAGVDGTLTGISVAFQSIPSGDLVPFTVTDGTGKVLFTGDGWNNGSPVLALSGLSIGFTDGLNFNLPSGGPAGVTASVNVQYTVP